MTVYIVDIEGISTRYTCEWKTHVPDLLRSHGLDVVVIEGSSDLPDNTTPGAFLNFSATNIYKSEQIIQISKLFSENKIKNQDYFLFTDAWHPGVLNLRYMADLLGVQISIGGLWHAGNYDPHDFLGKAMPDVPWVRHAELSFFNAYDHNYFATEFHAQMMYQNLLQFDTLSANKTLADLVADKKVIMTGWPMEYMAEAVPSANEKDKEDIILFPHRLSEEKNIEMFRDLAAHMPEYQFVACQEKKLSKPEYHEILKKSKILFSANLQETLGITTCAEGPLAGCIPMAPNRLSYEEIFDGHLSMQYPSEWTDTWDNYILNRHKLIARIRHLMSEYSTYRAYSDRYVRDRLHKFFSADVLIATLKNT